eukprot:12591-Heterococcus_DN1.PRE.4
MEPLRLQTCRKENALAPTDLCLHTVSSATSGSHLLVTADAEHVMEAAPRIYAWVVAILSDAGIPEQCAENALHGTGSQRSKSQRPNSQPHTKFIAGAATIMGGNIRAACSIALLASATAFVPAPLQTVRQSGSQLRMAADASQGSDTVPNKYSSILTQRKSQGASQAMLYATGLTPDDMNKAQVGISSVWFEGNPCNMHLLDLAAKVKEGVDAAGMVSYRFNTIGVSDGISMGTDGMCFSLQSRDLIADSIETVMGGQWYDANVAIPGCDKNMPGCLIAMGRLNRPALMVYGGTIRAGHTKEYPQLDIVSAFQSYGEYAYDRITEEQRLDIVRNSCPGPGACGGMYTANTMATAIEALGMSLPYSSSTPADDDAKRQE